MVEARERHPAILAVLAPLDSATALGPRRCTWRRSRRQSMSGRVSGVVSPSAGRHRTTPAEMRPTDVSGRRSAGVLTLGWGIHAPERRGCPTDNGNPVSCDPGFADLAPGTAVAEEQFCLPQGRE